MHTTTARPEQDLEIPASALVPNLKQCALLLDVDGTILDLAPTPREVWVPPALRRTMALLSERTDGAVALVSGRSLNDLDLIFAPLQLPTVGGHGAEFRPTTGGDVAIVKAAPLDPAIKRRIAMVAEIGPGILVEDKGYSIALHYRLAPELEVAVHNAVAKINADLPASIEVLPGKSVLEIKPSGFNKATGVRTLMKYPPFCGRHPIFIGDDVTDESVFAIIPEFQGLAFSVGRTVPGVNGHFDKPKDVRAWLARIAGEEESTAQ